MSVTENLVLLVVATMYSASGLISFTRGSYTGERYLVTEDLERVEEEVLGCLRCTCICELGK